MQIPYIRPYNNDDLAAITRINRQLEILPFSEKWALGHYLSAVAKSRGGCFVAEDSANRLVAFGVLNPVPGRPKDLGLHLAVDPNHQHTGVGKALIETLKDVARHREASSLIVISKDENLEVANFLEATGFGLRNYTWQMNLAQPILANIGRSPLPQGLNLDSLRPGEEEEFSQLSLQALSDKPRFERYIELRFEALSDHLDYQPGDVLVIRETENNTAVGIAVLQLESDSEEGYLAQVEPLGVVPNWRGKGLELVLLKAALVRARERGAVTAEIWVHSADSMTLDVYSKVGFERVGMRLTYICQLATNH